MDDEDELKDFNLSSRVLREERRRQRERGRLERELEREREAYGSRDSSKDSLDAATFSGPGADSREGGGGARDGGGTASVSSSEHGGGAAVSVEKGGGYKSRDENGGGDLGPRQQRWRRRGGGSMIGKVAGGFAAWGRSVRSSGSSNGVAIGNGSGSADRGDLAAGKPTGAAGKATTSSVVEAEEGSVGSCTGAAASNCAPPRLPTQGGMGALGQDAGTRPVAQSELDDGDEVQTAGATAQESLVDWFEVGQARASSASKANTGQPEADYHSRILNRCVADASCGR